MLNLFNNPSAGNASAAPQAKQHRRQNITSAGGAAAATVSASQALTASGGTEAPAPRVAHAFNAPEAEQVLGLRRLLVKVVGARDLPEKTSGIRRSCSAEVQLVDARGSPFGSGSLHARTGPPNHFTTVKDTSPVWNAEFVTELPGESADLLSSGASLRFDVWDEAASPALHLGAARFPASELQRLCMREEERTLTLERPGAAGMAGSAGAAAGGTLRVRLSYVDVRAAMALLGQAEAMAAEAEAGRASSASELAARDTQLKVLAAATREEEERAAFFHSEQRRGGPFGSAAQAAAKEREEARL